MANRDCGMISSATPGSKTISTIVLFANSTKADISIVSTRTNKFVLSLANLTEEEGFEPPTPWQAILGCHEEPAKSETMPWRFDSRMPRQPHDQVEATSLSN